MASVLSRRLGKRSLLGARVLGPSASDGLSGSGLPSESQGEPLEGAAAQPFLTTKDASCQEQPKDVLKTPCSSGLQQMVFQPGQKVGLSPCGQEYQLRKLGVGRPWGASSDGLETLLALPGAAGCWEKLPCPTPTACCS